MSENTKETRNSENPWIEAAAIIIAAVILATGFFAVLAVIYMGLHWSLGVFGIKLSIDQFVAGLFMLVVLRIVGSYLFVRRK